MLFRSLLLDTEGSAGVLVRVYYADTRQYRNTRFDLPLDAVYPSPQQSKFTTQTVAFSGKPSVTIRSAKAGGSKLLEGVPEKSGAYKLVISPQGKVGIGAHDERGAFYAMQTLRQLGTKAGGEGVILPVGEIIDWPDIEFRGTVEGFYGTPWSHEARLSQLRFYGQNKMNTYIYGPKDDPYHSSPDRKSTRLNSSHIL